MTGCISTPHVNGLTDLGKFDIDTNTCPAGIGRVKVECLLGDYFGGVLEISINDVCETPVVISGNTHSLITQRKLDILGANQVTYAKTIPNFLSISDTTYCSLNNCKIVNAPNSGTCGTTYPGFFTVSAEVGTSLTL